MIFLSEDELLPLINQRIQVISREELEQVERLSPVWQAVALGGVLKLIKNRIRYNALMNFLKLKVDARYLEILEGDLKGNDDLINSFGESLIGILFPDKKSALAIALSQKMQCKSSFFLKGLTFDLGIFVLQLKKEEESLKDFSTFCEHFISFKSVFADLISNDLQKSIIEILLLNDVLKTDNNLIFTDSFEESEELEVGRFSKFLNNKWLLIVAIAALLISLIIYFTAIKSDNTVSIDESEEIIPLDSLNKLNDSLTQVAVDSTKLLSDSTITLSWTPGKNFTIPKQSSLVSLHAFLNDSTAIDPLNLSSYEVSFNNETDQVAQSKEYFFKRFTEGLQVYKDVKIEIIAFSDKDSKSALKRGFFLKNRLVGEGLSPKRIAVVSSNAGINPDASIPLNNQVVIRVLK